MIEKVKTISLVLLPVFLFWAAVPAMTLRNKAFVCPIDGTEFEQTIALSGTQFGMRLDMKPLGPTPAPWPIPSCPECRFPLFKDEFTEEEIDRYREFVETRQFREETADSPPYFALAKVKAYDGESSGEIAYAYLQASWQVEENREGYERCLKLALEEYREFFEAERAGVSDEDWLTAGILIAELERQLGNFDGALAQVESLGDEPIEDEFFLKLLDQIETLARSEDTHPHPIE